MRQLYAKCTVQGDHPLPLAFCKHTVGDFDVGHLCHITMATNLPLHGSNKTRQQHRSHGYEARCRRDGAACGAGCRLAMRSVPYHPSMKEDDYEQGATKNTLQLRHEEKDVGIEVGPAIGSYLAVVHRVVP